MGMWICNGQKNIYGYLDIDNLGYEVWLMDIGLMKWIWITRYCLDLMW